MHTVVYVISSFRVGRTTLRSSATTWRRNSAIRAKNPRLSALPRTGREGADAPLGRAPWGSPTSPVLVWLTRPSPVVVVHGTRGTHSAPGAGDRPDGPERRRRLAAGRYPPPHRGATQGRRDLNPQPPVLETGALPIELLPFGRLLAARSRARCQAAQIVAVVNQPIGVYASRGCRVEPVDVGATGRRPAPLRARARMAG